MKTPIACIALVLCTGGLLLAGPEQQGHRGYCDGVAMAEQLAENLSQTLPTGIQLGPLDRHPIAVDARDLPIIMPIATTAAGKVTRDITISSGLIALLQQTAHAKAIDRVQPGFFDTYCAKLATNGPTGADFANATYWTDNVMNDQGSYFNQMVGMLVAINLSHYYLGHYDKHAAKLAGPGAKIAPINECLSAEEWEASVQAASHNSLKCALGMEGVETLISAIDKMGQRPPWAIYVAPPNVDLKKLKADLSRYEYEFFHGALRR